MSARRITRKTPSSEARDYARSTRLIFVALTDEGFTEDQALALIASSFREYRVVQSTGGAS